MSPRYFGEREAGWEGGRQRHLQLAGAPGSHVPRTASWWVSSIHSPGGKMAREGGLVMGKPSPQRQADWPPQTQCRRACSPDPTPAGRHITEGLRASATQNACRDQRQPGKVGEGRERAQEVRLSRPSDNLERPWADAAEGILWPPICSCFQSLSAENC